MIWRAEAHAKVNLHLGVGPLREDGFHELLTVFQSLSLRSVVELEARPRDEDGQSSERATVVDSLAVTGLSARMVPTDTRNLAWQAVDAVARSVGVTPAELPDSARLRIQKGIPVAGGMAGGSADAAAALLLAQEWLSSSYGAPRLPAEELERLAAELGSDVPFTLRGGTMLGRGRGEQLTPVLSRGTWWWVLALAEGGLSTPTVFHKLDELRAKGRLPEPSLDSQAVVQALASGDPWRLAEVIHNDLEPAALSVRPDLRRTLHCGRDSGALAGIVSGSGPTCAFLCSDEAHARAVAADIEGAGVARLALVANAPAGGATILPQG